MGFGDFLADTWAGATDAARAATSAVLSGAQAVGEAAIEGARIVGGAIVDTGKIVGKAALVVGKAAFETTAAVAIQGTEAAAGFLNYVPRPEAKGAAYLLSATAQLAKAVVAGERFLTENVLGAPCVVCEMARLVRRSTGQMVTPEQARGALDMARLSNAVYGDYEKSPAVPFCAPEGWEIIDTFDEESGMQAALYKGKDGQMVLAFRGTEPGRELVKDGLQADLGQGAGLLDEQYQQAASLAIRMKAKYPNLQMTGHSLGGGLATLAAKVTGSDATVFNAAPLGLGSQAIVDSVAASGDGSQGRITGISTMSDPLTDALNSPLGSSGFGVLGKKNYDTVFLDTPADIKEAHLMPTILGGLEATAGP